MLIKHKTLFTEAAFALPFVFPQIFYLRLWLYGIKRLAYAAAYLTQKHFKGAAIIRENETKRALYLLCAVCFRTKLIKIFGKLFGQSFSMFPLQFLYITERYNNIIFLKNMK